MQWYESFFRSADLNVPLSEAQHVLDASDKLGFNTANY